MASGFDFDGVDLGLYSGGFTMEGFEVEPTREEPTETVIYKRPIVYAPQAVCYEHAEDFARDLTIDNETETFAFVSGNFIFGDFVEALFAQRRISARRMGIQTLSMSDENIDSIRNILEWEPVERLDIVLSDYWFSRRRRPVPRHPVLMDAITDNDPTTRVVFDFGRCTHGDDSRTRGAPARA